MEAILGLTVGGSIIAFFLVAWASRAIGRSHYFTRRYVNLAYGSKTCTHCTVGTQILNEKNEWGPIPEHLHYLRKGEYWLGSRQANTRPCPWCNTTGMMPYQIPGVKDEGHVRYLT